jgi:uncharacterized protein YecE (DUF72 family)
VRAARRPTIDRPDIAPIPSASADERPAPERPDGATGGRLRVGTSGFAYPDWAPRFYPAGIRAADLLGHYAGRFGTVELNNTYYQQPSEPKVRAWLAATPDAFRFAVKAQRGGSFRALAVDPTESVPWLVRPYAWFGERLGAVLFRVPERVHRDDERLARFLDAWPRSMPLTVELQEPDWHVDETFTALARAGAVLCTTELPEDEIPPTIRRTGAFLDLRLRRHDYADDELAAWADRIVPFLDDGLDVYAFFRHDETGRATELATVFDALVAARRA